MSSDQKLQANRADVERAYQIIHGGAPVELRVLKTGGGAAIGRFNDAKKLVDTIVSVSALPEVVGTFFNLQELKAEVPCENKLSSSTGIRNTDISRYRFLPIDCDPVRKAGQSSTADEKAAALEVAKAIRIFLLLYGIESALFDSGNGYHVLVLIDVLNDVLNDASGAALVKRTVLA